VVHVEVKRRPENGGVRGAQERVTHNAPAFGVISTRLRASILKNFRLGGWYPARWPKSIGAMLRGGKTLVDRSTLRGSISTKSGDNYAAAGTSVKYAAVHQFGATIRAKTARGLRFRIGQQWVTKRSVVIPPRPFLPVRFGRLHPDDSKYVGDVLRNWVANGRAMP